MRFRSRVGHRKAARSPWRRSARRHSAVLGILAALFTFAALAAPGLASAANEWNGYGDGPANTRDNTGETFLTPATLPSLARGWVFSDPSSAYEEYSEPAVVKGVAYFGLRNGIVYALDLATGEKLWEYQTGASVLETPVISGGVLYVGSFDGDCYAIEAATDTLKWRFDTGGGAVSSPVVARGSVFFNGGNDKIYALDAQTGSQVWEDEATNPRDGYSNVAYLSGELYYTAWVPSGENYAAELIALSASSGAQSWHRDFYETWDPSSISEPTVAHGEVYAWEMAGYADGRIAGVSAKSGRLNWWDPGSWFGGDVAAGKSAVFAGYGYNNPGPCSPYAGGNCGYPAGSGIVAMDPTTGAPLWADPGSQNSPTLAGNLVYGVYSTELGTYFGAAEATTGKIVWQDAALEGALGPVAQGNVLFPSGNAIWDYQLPIAQTVAPAISGTPKTGDTLKVTTGAWSGALKKLRYAYQWERCNEREAEYCYRILGATTSSYKVTTEDVGFFMTAIVTASNEQQGAHAKAPAVGPAGS
jgi:outer membrane protein assembly factor BamB